MQKLNQGQHKSNTNRIPPIEQPFGDKALFNITGRPSDDNLAFWVSFIMILIKRPIFFFKHINKKNLKTLRNALVTEDKTTILRNLKYFLTRKQEQATHSINKEAAILNEEGFFFQIDNADFFGQSISIEGWALSLFGITSIEVWNGSNFLGYAKYGHPREDVAKVYPHIQNSSASGVLFQYTFESINSEGLIFLFKFFNNDIIIFSKEIEIVTNVGNSDTSASRLLEDLMKNAAKNAIFYSPKACKKYIRSKDDIKLLAYYLPQFHTIPENDEWWGKGFTEWTNVTQGIPRFNGHYQPRLPGELGFYDLRDVEVMRRQVELASQYGLYGFCFHYYWFSGKRVLEIPLNNFFNDIDIDFPFCVNWANENWTRRWDGAENDILLKQDYTDEDAVNFYNEVSILFNDSRYIKIEDRPVLLIYRPTHIPNVKEWTNKWRALAKNNGHKPPYLIACGSFEYVNPSDIGFDASVEFPPHQLDVRYPVLKNVPSDITGQLLNKDCLDLSLYDSLFDGKIFDYRIISRASFVEPNLEQPWFRCVMPSWDNEARKKGKGHSFHYADPFFFRNWLNNACNTSFKNNEPTKRFVFINAWNEWAEGAYLEPDRHYGYANLQVVAETLSGFSTNKENKINFSPYGLVKRASIAVVLHLFYIDLFEGFIKQLENIPKSFDLYISVTEKNAFFKQKILKIYPNAQVYIFPNRGRDVGPFIEIMNKINLLEYDLILKIHSKKSLCIEDGDHWRDYLVSNLLGDKENVNKILLRFKKNKQLGLLAPIKAWLPLKGDYIRDNISNMYQLGVLLNIVDRIALIEKNLNGGSIKGKAPLSDAIDLSYPHFPGGTMFWFRPKALEGLFSLALTQADFQEENGQLDATLAHAIERLIGILPNHNSYLIDSI